MTLVNGHYQLPLPWRPGFRFLPNNRQMALQRLSCLKKRLAKNPDLKQKYVDTIQGYLADDYAALAPLHEDDSTVWFLPHHAVLHPKKPDRLRVVFDCAAKFKHSLYTVLSLWTTLSPGQKPKFWNWKTTTGNDYPSKAGI